MENVNKKSMISLKGKDIMPTKPEQRTMKPINFMVIWWGMAIQLVAFIAGAQLFPALSPKTIVTAAIVGNLVTALLLTLTGDIGIKYGITFSVYIRAAFGYLGAHIPSLIRAAFAIFWFGYQTWFCAYAMDNIMIVLTGYSNLNLLIIIVAVLQIWNMMHGMKGIALMEQLAAPALMVVGVYLLFTILGQSNSTVGDVLAIEGTGGVHFGYAIAAMMGHYITMSLNIPEFTRYLKTPDPYKNNWFKTNFGSFWSQTIGLVSAFGLFTLIGIVCAVIAGNWNPIEVMVDIIGPNSPFLLVICLLFVLFAQWSTNTAANLLPPTYIIVNLYPKKISVRIAAIIAGTIGIIARPWIFADNTVMILIVSSAFLGPVAGIMISDYYLLRKRKLNVNDLYDANGQYRYAGNFNPAAFIAMIPAAILAFKYPDYGVQISIGVSAILYYLLMKFWIAKKYYQPEILDPNFDVKEYVIIPFDETDI